MPAWAAAMVTPQVGPGGYFRPYLKPELCGASPAWLDPDITRPKHVLGGLGRIREGFWPRPSPLCPPFPARLEDAEAGRNRPKHLQIGPDRGPSAKPSSSAAGFRLPSAASLSLSPRSCC